MQQPSLTVVVTSYNYSNYISKCIESILDQDYSDFELIILDNCSADDTVEVVSRFLNDERVRLVRHSENIGACLNFNSALRVGSGRYLSLVSADDCLLPGHFSRLMSALKRNASCVLAYSPIVMMDSCGMLHGAQKHSGYAETAYYGGRDEFSDLLVHDCYVTLCSAIFDRDQISGDLYFDIEAWGGADWEFFVRLAGKYKNFAFEPLPGSCYRIHDKQYSRNNFYSSLEPLYTHLYIVEKYLDKILAECAGSSGWVAAHLRRRAGQYGSFNQVHLQRRLDKALLKLERGISSLESGAGSFSNVIVGSGGNSENIHAVLSNLPSSLFLDVDDIDVAVSVNDRVYFSSCDFVLLAGGHGFPCCEDILNVRDFLDQHPSIGAVSFVFPESGMDNAAVHQENAKQVCSVFCRRSVFEKAGGYNPSLVLGEGVWDFTLKLLREGQRVQSQVMTTRAAGHSSNNLLSWASIVFRNTLYFSVSDIARAATFLLDNTAAWRGKIEKVLRHEPSCGSAYFFDLLAKCRADQPEKSPLFSVVLTTYNRPELLKDALTSISQQSLKDFEVILINDNGEPVESLLAAYDFPITYIRQGVNRGLSAARNTGLKLARGRYIVYLDDDDIYLPSHLAVLAEAFVQHPHSVVYTGVEYVSERLEGGRRIELGRSQPFRHEAFDRDRLFAQNYIPVNTWAHPRDMLGVVGEFDTELAAFEDWDMLLRLASRYPFVHVPVITSEVHTREQSASGDHMLGRERKNFPALYQLLYQRYPGSDSEVLKYERGDMLQRLGVSVDRRADLPPLQRWLAERLPTEMENHLINQYLQEHDGGPLIGIIVLDVEGQSAPLMQTLKSLIGERCLYATLKIVVLTSSGDAPKTSAGDKLHFVRLNDESQASQVNRVVSESDFAWLMLASAGDEFTPSGLMVAGLELAANPGCRAIYGDQLQRLPDGGLGGAFLPSFNLDLLLSFPLVMARHWLFRRDVFLAAGGFDAEFAEALEFDLLVRLIEEQGLVGLGHVDEPLLITAAPALQDNPDERRVIERHLARRGYQARVVPGLPARYRIDYGHSNTPQVSIIIAVDAPLACLQRCLDSLLEKTRYSHYEVLLAAHDGLDASTQAWLQGIIGLADAQLRVIAAADVSQAQNQAAMAAQGEYLLLLSGESVTVSESWLDELLNHAQRPEVGIVGAKLLSSDGRIDQAGLLLGLRGPAGRAFAGEAMDSAGYLQRLQVDQNYSAVSDACLMVRAEIFRQLGGLDTTLNAYRDVDFCLRVRAAGYLTVWAAHAVLMHEHVYREPEVAEQDALYERHLADIARDPAYNRNLALSGRGFDLEIDSGLTWRPLSWRPLPVVLSHPADPFGCGNYRVIKPFSALKDAGMVDGMMSIGLLQVPDLERLDPDVIVLQRQIGDERLDAMRRIKKFSRAFTIYELDDYLPNLPLKSVHRAQMPKDILKSLRKGLSFVDRFTVSTAPLAEAFAGLHGDIRVVENRLPLDWWSGLTAKRQRGRKPRVGWAGGVSHTGDLELITDVVKELAGEVEWVFMGMCPDRIRPYVHELHAGVAIDLYPAALANLDLDLALAPVEQNLFNECKSNLRLLEYGACGFPVVCSDLVCYQGSLPVTRVKNRFKDWVDAIRMHISDLDASARMGDELRRQVLGDWMLDGENLEAWRASWLPD